MDRDQLDLLSTSQTNPHDLIAGERVGHELQQWVHSQKLIQDVYREVRCANGAPFIFFVDANGVARVVQGNCNSWLCERCGHLRALAEYGRMVNGAKILAESGESLYFLTLTCRGRELAADEAENGYLEWTNKFLTGCRMKQQRAGLPWFYAQVTERQKRGHPHSHLITTFAPDDVQDIAKGAWIPNETEAKHDTLYSPWLERAAVRAGLGRMVDLSYINSPVAVAVYAAKYMFKDAIATNWPTGWRRVRYSNSWPKLPVREMPLAFPLLHFNDWLRMQALGYTVHADSQVTTEAAYARTITCVVPPAQVA